MRHVDRENRAVYRWAGHNQGRAMHETGGEPAGRRLPPFAGNGDLFIGSKSGKVYRLPPPYTAPEVLVTLDDYPHSVAFRRDEILIARTNGVYRAPYRPGQQRIAPGAGKCLARLPGGGGDHRRTLGVC